MDVTRTGGNNLSAANNIRIAGYSDRMLQAMKERSEATPDSEPAVMVEISEEGRLASMLNKEFDLTDAVALKVDEGLLGAQGPLEGWVRSTLEEFTLSVRILFLEGTLERFISDALDDKARNSTIVASELATMIKSTAYGNGATVEERALNREIGMENARHIAETYFDNPDEAQAFLDEINRFYEKDVLREKGYMVFDNREDIAPYRSYSMPNAPNEFLVNGNATLKHFGASDEILNDHEKAIRFLTSLNDKMRGGQWQKDIAEAFEKNEKEVASIIDKIRASVLNEADVANSLARILKAF